MSHTIHLYATTQAIIFGNSSFWQITPPQTTLPRSKRAITLEIIGDAAQGVELVISPKGLYTASLHCASLADAQCYAHEWLGITPHHWDTAMTPLAG
ncbi:hypothetical protein JYB87_02010 [Shewanella avicenniae]|uniref:Uncharacterized protein n=1 Tax=Shewanella avicenniae TaxID=2814294 RepID=A0ABX7QT02_9GAMM|nr:hypothetical protein [Shewanella avicenniae]QSX34050.1 hypothetical protein JYB87_02010 [Shewanella avicenniae]